MTPPGDDVVERARILTKRCQSVNSCALLLVLLAALLGAPSRAAAAHRPTVGELRLLVILAAFPDRPLAHPPAYFLGAPEARIDRLVAYYREVSAGRLTLVPHLGSAAVTLPEPRPRYVQQPAKLAGDALRAFAAVATDDGDRRALADSQALIVFFAGPGRESHTEGGDPTDPWSNYTAMLPNAQGFPDACVIAEEEVAPFSNFGVLCHEFGHLLGLPELYAPGGRPQEGIGVWGLMGQGTWVGRGDAPSGLDAWSKLRLGWVDVETVTATTRNVALPAVLATPRIVRIPAVPGRPQEYYLLENRTRTGVDSKLPGEGLLVWHVDERMESMRGGELDVAHPLLRLVQADGREDLERGHAAGGNRGDATDPWWGPPAWHRRAAGGLALAGALLGAAAAYAALRGRGRTRAAVRLAAAAAALGAAAWLRREPVCGPGTPGMAPYGGAPVRIVLRRFSPPGPVMHVDVLVAPEPPGS
jgi:immune inhibitor A